MTNRKITVNRVAEMWNSTCLVIASDLLIRAQEWLYILQGSRSIIFANFIIESNAT